MSWLKALAAGCVLAAQIATTITASTAADMPKGYPGEPLPLPTRPAPRSFDLNSGWYIRGDLGYGWGRIDSAQAAPTFPNPTSGLGNAATGGVGFGIKRGGRRGGRVGRGKRAFGNLAWVGCASRGGLGAEEVDHILQVSRVHGNIRDNRCKRGDQHAIA